MDAESEECGSTTSVAAAVAGTSDGSDNQTVLMSNTALAGETLRRKVKP